VLLTVASLTFTSDTQKIIIAPITKMVGIIQILADEPFKKPEPPKERIGPDPNDRYLKT
jgi:hypothetical protein